jgi:hypothetical protein
MGEHVALKKVLGSLKGHLGASGYAGCGGGFRESLVAEDGDPAVSPNSVWRVLSRAGFLRRWNVQPSKKGTGFVYPPGPQEDWHVDVSNLNLTGTFYYMCSVLDGYSRYVVH